MAEIDISNVISVTISATPITMKQANLSTIAIFTTDQGNGEEYTIYRSPTAVANDWGSDSEVYKQAVAIFSQAPNILTPSGYLVVVPMLQNVVIPASAGYSLCQAINLANFRTVEDGSISFNVDNAGARVLTGLNFSGAKTTSAFVALWNNIFENSGRGYRIVTKALTASDFASVSDGSIGVSISGGATTQVSGLDFSSVTNITQLAHVFDSGFEDAEVAVSCHADTTNNKLIFETETQNATVTFSIIDGTSGTGLAGATYLDISNAQTVVGISPLGVVASIVDGQLKFTSSTTGTGSSVVIASDDTGTDLSGVDYLDTASIVRVAGINAYTGRERLVDAIIRATPLVYFNGCMVDHDYDDDEELLNASDYVQTQSKMLFVGLGGETVCNTGSVFDRVRLRGNTHTRCLAYFGGTNKDARLFASAYASRGLSVDFGGTNTTLTMQLKALSGIEPDAGCTETLLMRAKAVGADVYCSIDGISCVMSYGNNEFFDNVYNDIWLKTALQVAGFNLLRSASSKIPQTRAGLEMLIAAYTAVLQKGIKNGAFAAGTWTLPVTFGDPVMLKQNVASVGYYIYATPMEEQDQSERDERKAPFIQMAVKRAGAVHSSNILVYINN